MSEERFWIETRWPSSELNGKTVEFDLRASKHHVTGLGTFRARQRLSGEQKIEIVVTLETGFMQKTDYIFTLTQFYAERIRKHPDPEKADFAVS